MIIKKNDIEKNVSEFYTSIARKPDEKYPIPVGFEFALNIGYPAEILGTLPKNSVNSFAGISNVSIFAEIQEGDTVLDLGCGAGMDTFILANRVGENGKVISLDFSEGMLNNLQKSIDETGAGNIFLKKGNSDNIPLENCSVDKAIVNGIFNLNPKRQNVFSELERVLKPGGELYVAELVLINDLPEKDVKEPDNWFA